MNESGEASAAEACASKTAAKERRPGAAARLVKGIEAFIEGLGRVAAWAGLGLVVLIAANVILRYVFRFSLVSLQELEWHLIPPIVMIGNAYALRHGEHVRVDLLFENLPAWAQHLIDLVVALTLIIICVVVIYVSVPWVLQSYELREGSPDPGGLPYRFILKAFIPFGFLLLVIQAIAEGLKAVLLMLNVQGGHGHGK